MRYASSIRFGGQLVDAKDCDYSDYKRLQLNCPNCKEPVFLQDESTRLYNGKTINVSAHFKHYPTVDAALIKQCELKVNNYSQADIKKWANESKKQRLKIIQKHFWHLFINNVFCLKCDHVDGLRPHQMEKLINDFLSPQRKIEFNVKHFKTEQECSTFYNGYIKDYNFYGYLHDWETGKKSFKNHISDYIKNPQCDLWERIKGIISSQVNLDFHYLILDEIVDFLFTKSSRQILMKCMAFGLFARVTGDQEYQWDWFKTQVRMGFPLAQVMLCAFAMDLITIDWAEIFSQPDKYMEYKLKPTIKLRDQRVVETVSL